MNVLSDLLRKRINGCQIALKALVRRSSAAGPNPPEAVQRKRCAPLDLNVHAPGQPRDIEELGSRTVRTRPIVVPPENRWTDLFEGRVRREIDYSGVGLDIFRGIII